MSVLKAIGGLLVLLFLFLGLGWLFAGNSFFMYSFFAPKVEQVRYDTFKQSQTYNDGMAQELQQFQRDYMKGSKEEKDALGSMILKRYADYDTSKLNSDLQAFLEKVKREKGLR